MSGFTRRPLNDEVLLRQFHARDTTDKTNHAEMLADLGEVEARRVYLPAACASMFDYCVRRLHWSEDVAHKRRRVAAAARKYRGIFEAIADGRLHITGVFLLAKHLTRANARELLTASVHKTKSEIEQLLADRFPKPDVPFVMRPLGAAPTAAAESPVPGRTDSPQLVSNMSDCPESRMSGLSNGPGPEANESRSEPAASTPSASQRYATTFTMPQTLHDKLRHLQSLLGREIPSADPVAVLERACDLAIAAIEKKKLAATDKPRAQQRTPKDPHYVPAAVKREVWKRDGHRCTFVNPQGERCSERRFLELDHIEAAARGGRSTPSNLRLLCRAHNQYSAEQTYGAGFLRFKRDRHRTASPPSLAPPAAVDSGVFLPTPERPL